MRFVSLIDTRSNSIITIDANALMLRLEIDDIVKETRLKAYHAAILYELFYIHPNYLSYGEITKILKDHHLMISDLTRMHRKLSEVRSVLQFFHPSLQEVLLNNRSVGYSLPLQFKNIRQLESKNTIKFKNQKIAENMRKIINLINDAIELTAGSKVILCAQGFMLNRDSCRQILVDKVADFNKSSDIILKEMRVHDADFIGLRAQYFFAKLKTYVGLARVSEYAISEVQWLDWFKQEVWMLFEDLQRLIKMTE